VPKDPSKIQQHLESLSLILPVGTKFLGCDDCAGMELPKFTSLKINASLLKTMSAQKLSTRLTTTKHNDLLNIPLDGATIKIMLRVELYEKDFAKQFEAINGQMKSSCFVGDDLRIDPAQKGSSLKALSKNFKKVTKWF
jgi:hypothetical protein